MNENYLIMFHKPELIRIIEAEDTAAHYSISINFIVLFEQHPIIAQKLLGDEPEQCLGEFDNACVKAQLSLLKDANVESKVKPNVHCRFFQLPALPAIRKSVFPGNLDVGKFLQLSGTVMRMTAPKVLEFQRRFVCTKCKGPVLQLADFERMYSITQPRTCSSPDCSGTNFLSLGELDPQNCKDYQEIKIQEQVKDGIVGTMPATLWVTLEDDVVDLCKPGDNVTICGILKRRWNDFYKGKRLEMELVLKTNSIQVDNTVNSANLSTPESQRMFEIFWEKYATNPLEGRDVILRSFCPEIYGLYLVKLAVTVILAGGTPPEELGDVGIRTRADSHILLVGDPGTGKSNLLHFAAKVIPRSVLTTGVGSTAAGLTVTAIMEHGEWQLEAGALVMSDGGICCIDEFSSMKDHDRTCIHEAMEQQSISVAKASMVCKLNTRCSILAACNFKVNTHVDLPLNMIINLPSPLLSRFDLIMLLNDKVCDQWDKKIADYILNGGSKLSDSSCWTIEMLQAYFLKIKKLKPKLTEDTEVILNSYYQMQRRAQKRNKARTTVRLLESLVRLSQGHAKLMLHEKVEIMDTIYAITLIDAAMEEDSCILKLDLTSNSSFPEVSTEDYKNLLAIILGRLQLPGILQKEERKLYETTYGKVRSRYFGDHVKGENHSNLDTLNPCIPHESQISNVVDGQANEEESIRLMTNVSKLKENEATLGHLGVEKQFPEEILPLVEPMMQEVNVETTVSSEAKAKENITPLNNMFQFEESESPILNCDTLDVCSDEQSHQCEILREIAKDISTNNCNNSLTTVQLLTNRIRETNEPTEVKIDNTIDQKEDISTQSNTKRKNARKILEQFKFVRKPKDSTTQEKRKFENSNINCDSITHPSKKMHTGNVNMICQTKDSDATVETEHDSEELLRSQFDTEDDVDLDF